MSKVSAPTFVVCGLGDPKVSLHLWWRVTDGLLVNIPVLDKARYTWGGTMMDIRSVKVNLTSKQLDSLGRQIHSGVYSSCNGSWLLVSFDY